MTKLALLAVFMFLASPAGAAEALQPGELVESVDASTVLVKCSGIAADTEKAILHARRGCVEWYVLNRLTFSEDEKKSYRAVRGKIFSRLDKYIERPVVGARSGRGKGIKARIQISDTQLRVIVIVGLYKKTLREDLAVLGVLAKQDPHDPNNLTLAVFPSKAMKKSRHRKTVSGVITTFLIERGWKVNPGCSKVPGRLIKALDRAMGGWDAHARCALAAGSDAYIVFDAIKDEKGGKGRGSIKSVAFTVNLTAYKTTPGAMLASGTALSSPRAAYRAGQDSAAAQEASQDALLQIEKNLTEFSRKLSSRGRVMVIVLDNAPDDTDRVIRGAIKAQCSPIHVLPHGEKDRIIMTHCKTDTQEIYTEIKKVIGAKHKRMAQNRNMILLRFK